MIRAIIWDIGGVLWRTPDPFIQRRWEGSLGLPAGGLAQIIFGSPVALQATIGNATPAEVWGFVGQTLNLSEQELNKLKSEIWTEGIWDMELLTFIKELKGEYKTGIISDAWIDARESVSAWINDELFDVILYSAEEGVKKPNPIIFERMLERLEVNAEEVIFVDDWLDSVEGANAMGINGIHFSADVDIIAKVKQRIE